MNQQQSATAEKMTRMLRPGKTNALYSRQDSSKRHWLVIVLAALGAVAFSVVLPRIMLPDPLPKVKSTAASRPAEFEPANDGQDWPQWRGPSRDGRSREVGLATDWPQSGPPRLWQQKAGPGYSSVAVARDRVLTLMKEVQSETVVCWHAVTGQELWRHSYGCQYPASIQFGSGPRSTPTVAGDVVYTVGATGVLHCLELNPSSSAGKVVWRKDLSAEFKAPDMQCGVAYSPLIEGDLLITMPGGPNRACVVALNRHSGEVRWHSLNDHPGYTSPVAATIAGRRQLVLLTGNAAVGLDPGTGRELWRFAWETYNGCNVATPIVHDDHVFISASYNQGCALLKIEREGDSFKPRLVYKNTKMRNHFSTSVLHEGRLFGFNEAILTCMDFMTGKVLWRENGLGKGSLLVADGHLFILSEQGHLVAAPASPNSFQATANRPVFATTCWTVPVLSHGRLYLRNEEELVCFDLRKRDIMASPRQTAPAIP